MTPRKHENRRKLKRPVSQNPGIYEEKGPKAFPSHTRAPARESLQREVWGTLFERGLAYGTGAQRTSRWVASTRRQALGGEVLAGI